MMLFGAGCGAPAAWTVRGCKNTQRATVIRRELWVMKCASSIVTVCAAIALLSGKAGHASEPAENRAASVTTKSIPASGGNIEVDLIPGFSEPWAIAFLPNGDALVTQRQNREMRLLKSSGELDPHSVTGLPEIVKSPNKTRSGIDVAVHPDFAENRFVYFTYFKPTKENIHVATPVLARGVFNDRKHRLDRVTDIFVSNALSVGGVATRITFGADRKIYMSIGSAIENKFAPFNDSPVGVGSAHDAQDPGSHAGKILRLNDDGSIPSDNPFVATKGYRGEIFALGIRNSLGLFFDAQTDTLWATDNGPFGGDEINVISAGANYGWPKVTYGRTYPYDPKGEWTGLSLPPMVQPPGSAPNMTQPFLFWVPSPAVAGIMLYTGDKFPAWRGNIMIAELKAQRLERIILNRQKWETDRQPLLAELKLRLRDIKQGPEGFIYATSEDGYLLRIRPATSTQRPEQPQ